MSIRRRDISRIRVTPELNRRCVNRYSRWDLATRERYRSRCQRSRHGDGHHLGKARSSIRSCTHRTLGDRHLSERLWRPIHLVQRGQEAELDLPREWGDGAGRHGCLVVCQAATES